MSAVDPEKAPNHEVAARLLQSPVADDKNEFLTNNGDTRGADDTSINLVSTKSSPHSEAEESLLNSPKRQKSGKNKTCPAVAAPGRIVSVKANCTPLNDVAAETVQTGRTPDTISLHNRDKFDTPVLETRPPNYMWLAICTTIFFNPVIGIIALVTAMQADTEYLHDNVAKSRRLGKVVKILSLIGILSTLVVLLVISVVFAS